MPYREPGRQLREDVIPAASRRDDAVLATMLIVLGGLRVGIALIGHETFGAEATIAAVMLVLGVALAA